ncbi:MAG: hypothetical protein V4736_07745, partial [Bdellovibrionota bacterium]
MSRNIIFLFVLLFVSVTCVAKDYVAQSSYEFIGSIQRIRSAREVTFTTTRNDLKVGDLLVVVSEQPPYESLA